MKNYLRRQVVFIAVLGIVGWAAVPGAFAGEMQGSMEEMKIPKGGEWRQKWEQKKQEMYQEIGISEEQQQKLEAHKEQKRTEGKALYELLAAKREALKQELQKPELNMKEVQRIHSEIKALKAQKEDARLAGILEVREILTPGQFTKLMEWKDTHEGKGWGHHKGFRGMEEMKGAPENTPGDMTQ